jgi:hypothetical protein
MEKIAAYWDLYDKKTGQLLEANRAIRGKSWPAIGGIIIGVTGRLNAIVDDVKLKGIKDGLPLFNVFI